MSGLAFDGPATPGFLTVVTPVYCDAQGLQTTLASLARQTLPTSEFEVIVCNDGDDPSVSEVCGRFRVKEVRISPNRGSYYARNRGIEAASGEHLAFVDADIAVREEWLDVGRDALRRADYVGGPVIVDETLARTAADFYEVLTGFQSNHPESGHNFFVTANLFVNRTVFERLGGFDERLRSGGDNEFGTRVHADGRFVQSFDERLGVLHPPRGYRKLIGKRVRIAYGKQILNRLHPYRYAYKSLPTCRRLVNAVVPPSLRKARKLHARVPQVGLASWYLFTWRYKAELAIRLLPLYRRAAKLAEALLAADPAREPEERPL